MVVLSCAIDRGVDAAAVAGPDIQTFKNPREHTSTRQKGSI